MCSLQGWLSGVDRVGGVFGNDKGWIDSAIRRSLKLVGHFELYVLLVSCGEPSAKTLILASDFGS